MPQMLARTFATFLLLTAGCSRVPSPDIAIALGDSDTVVLAQLQRVRSRDITDGLSLGYDPNAERGVKPESNYWRMWMLDEPRCAIETTFCDGKLVHLLFWDLRDRKIDRYFGVMAHDEVSSLSFWMKQNQFAKSVVRHINDGG